MQFIEDQKNHHPVKLLCVITGVNESNYYRWLESKDKPCIRELTDQQLIRLIVDIWQESRKNYGSPRILSEFRKRKIPISRKRIAHLMKKLGIKGRYNRRKKPLLTDSHHGGRISPNLLKQVNEVAEPGEAVVTDTTYIWTDSGWCYLATVMDLYNREIIGWAFSSKNDSDLVCKALWNASSRIKQGKCCLHHSDRGSTYCSDNYLKLLKILDLKTSMSAKGYCYDNAYMESFYGTLKCECEQLEDSLSPKETKLALFDYIEGFYNPRRIHTALGGMSPREYRMAGSSSTRINPRQIQTV